MLHFHKFFLSIYNIFVFINRCVKDAERSLALGVQLIFLRLLGNVPSPLAFAGLIDRSCLLWKKSNCAWGKCLFYDNLDFRKNYIGLGGVVKGFGFLVYWCVWGLIIWKNKRVCIFN